MTPVEASTETNGRSHGEFPPTRGFSPGAKRSAPYELMMSAGLLQVSPWSWETTTDDLPKNSPLVSRGSQPARKEPSGSTPAKGSGQRVKCPDRIGSSLIFQLFPPSCVTASSVIVEFGTA